MANFGPVKTWGNEVLTPADLNAEILNIINNVTDGGINADNIDETDDYAWSGATTFTGTVTTGVDDTGVDVKFFGATTGKSWLWDESANKMIIAGDAAVTGATTLTGATQQTGAFTVGVNDTGHDVKFFGATASKFWEWDESANQMNVAGSVDVNGATQMDGTLTVGLNDTGYDVQLFGATAGSHLLWDESADSLLMVGGAKINAQGTVIVGVDDTGYDVKMFGATSGKSWLWDESADTEILTGNSTISGTLGVTGVLTATAQSVHTGGLVSGSNIVSDADSTDDLGTTGVRWANLYVDAIVATDTIAATSYTGALLTAVTAVTQSDDNNSTKVATTAYVDSMVVGATGVSLSGSTNNTIATVTGANALIGEANLTFTGSVLTLTGSGTALDVTGTGDIKGRIQTTTDGGGGNAALNVKAGGTKGDWLLQTGHDIGAGGIRLYDVNATAERMRIAASGYVGIGIAAPDGKLHVHTASAGTITPSVHADELVVENSANSGISILSGNSAVGRMVFGDDGNSASGAIIYAHAANSLAFHTLATERMRIDSSGVVHIGGTTTTSNWSPTAYLNIEGTIPAITLRDTTGSADDWTFVNNNGALTIANDTNNTQDLVIDSSGKVGIGTNNPSGNGGFLTVIGNFASNYALKLQNAGDNANRYGIRVQAGAYNASGTTYYLMASDGDGHEVGYIANTSGTFAITDSSDERVKEDIVPSIVDGLSVINAVKVQDFTRKKSRQRVLAGFTAQQLLAAYPQAVVQPAPTDEILYAENDELPEGVEVGDTRVEADLSPMMGVTKDAFIGPLILAVQELTAKGEASDGAIMTSELRRIESMQELQALVEAQAARIAVLEAA